MNKLFYIDFLRLLKVVMQITRGEIEDGAIKNSG